jgi:exopolysaccharide biosynthesis polyprenyl glycosylphosphotransferase
MAKGPLSARYTALLLLASDVFGLVGFFEISYRLRFGEWGGELGRSFLWPATITLLALYVVDVYRTENQVSGMRAPGRTILGVAIAGLLTSVVAYAGGYWGSDPLFGRGVFPVALAMFTVWAAGWRYVMSIWARRVAVGVRWLVLGAGEPTAMLWKDFQVVDGRGEMIVLARDEDELRERTGKDLPRIAGTVDDVEKICDGKCSGIVIAMQPPFPEELVQRLMHIRFGGTRVYDLADFYESYWFKVPVMHLQSGWLVFSHGFDLLHNPIGFRVKRVVDILLSAVLLALLAPVMLLLAVGIKLESQGPVIFRQKRVGEAGKVFTIYKFRSMYRDAESSGAMWTTENDPRITKMGKLMRITRLDEIPQFFNVLTGNMSLIGPRPERSEFSDLYGLTPYYELRHMVRPGITGWAQVMYHYGASIEDMREKLQYDLYYIKNYSLLLDIAIFFKTLRVVILGRGR